MPQTILVIEDEAALRQALAAKLKLEKFNVIEAADGEQGITLARQNKPDLILLDILMPKMNGLDVLSALQTQGAGQMIPVIILSNMPEESSVQKAKALGAVEYLVKSDCPLEKLVEIIKSHLKEQ